jgi:uncharacterized SAM-binding protein YcdF (DUF218 family)
MKLLVKIIALFALLWTLGLGVYIYGLIQDGGGLKDRAPHSTEAVVVLTGGNNRLQAVSKLLKENSVKRLLITGVNEKVHDNQIFKILKATKNQIKCCIDIGYQAVDTRGNAEETLIWIKKHGFKKIRLVTSLEHMPRAITEFSRAMPDVEILSYPVGVWRPDNVNLYALLREYNKYLYSLIRSLF